MRSVLSFRDSLVYEGHKAPGHEDEHEYEGPLLPERHQCLGTPMEETQSDNEEFPHFSKDIFYKLLIFRDISEFSSGESLVPSLPSSRGDPIGIRRWGILAPSPL